MSYKITYKDGKTETIYADEFEDGDSFIEFVMEEDKPNIYINKDVIAKIE